MSDHITPPPPLLQPHWDAGASVDTDLHSLEDLMQRYARSDDAVFRFSHARDRMLRFVRQHLVSLIVLLALLSAALSAAA